MSDATFSTLGGRLLRLKLCGGSKPWGVETIEACNFEPHVIGRRVVGDVAFITIEGTQRTRSGSCTWQHEIPKRLLHSPRALHRALSGAMGATGIVWVGQSGHLARFLATELEGLVASS